MNKIVFLTGAKPPQTGGELYNYKLSEYLAIKGCSQEYVSLHQHRYYFRFSILPIIGDIFASLIFSIVLFKKRGILVEDHYFSKYLFCYNLLQRIFFKGKIIIIVHLFYGYDSNDKFLLRKLINKYIEKFRLSFADSIITSSEYSKSEIASIGINPDLIHVLSPGLDRNKFNINDCNQKSDSDSSKDNKKIKILCVGNYIPRKGIIYLIEALSKIEEQDFLVDLVGNCSKNLSYYHKLYNAVRKFQLRNRVVFHDGTDQENIKQLYEKADIFVLPSFKETFGIVFLEAMHYGLPIITTNVSAMPELVENGKNGLLIPPGDSHALADAISKLIYQPNLIKQMGEAGRTKIADSYYWEQTGDKFLSIIKNMN